MKLAAFLLGVLAVNGQTTIDPRRKKWKQQVEFDETTTTTTTTTEATTTTTTTVAPTTLKEATTTEEFVWVADQGNGQGDTKELQEQLAINKESEDPVSNTGFTFGSGFSTKGIEANGGGKGNKNYFIDYSLY